MRIRMTFLGKNPQILGNTNLFTKCLFTIFVPLEPPPPPNQQSDRIPLDFRLKGSQTEFWTLSQNCEQTLQKLRTKRITVDMEIKVKLIPRQYVFVFAFVLMLIGPMIFRIYVHIDTSPRIQFRFRFRNYEGN